MPDQSEQDRFDTAIRALEEAEEAMAGVNDPEIWLEVARVGGILQHELDGDDPSPVYEPWGNEPEILPDSPAGRAIALIGEAGKALVDIGDPRLRAMGQARLLMVNILTASGGDLSKPIGGPG